MHVLQPVHHTISCASAPQCFAVNLGGIKVSSVELERACLETLHDVIEVAAVACPTPGGLISQQQQQMGTSQALLQLPLAVAFSLMARQAFAGCASHNQARNSAGG